MLAASTDDASVTGPIVQGPTDYYGNPYSPEMLDSYWGRLITAPTKSTSGKDKTTFRKGANAPTIEQMTPQIQAYIRNFQGITDKISEKDAKKLMASGWQYGQPAPEGFEYDDHGVLQDRFSNWEKAGKVASVAIPIAATVATGGAASPWLAAAVGGGAALGAAKLGGASWKQALVAGALGAAGGGASASLVKSGASLSTRMAANAAVNASGSAAQGGGLKGAILAGGLGAAGTGVGAKLADQSLTSRLAANAGLAAGGTAAQGGSLKDSLLAGGVSAGSGLAANKIDPTGVRGDVGSVEDRVLKAQGGGMDTTQLILNAGIGAAKGYATGGTKGAVAGAAGGAVQGATGQSTNPTVQAAGQTGASLLSKVGQVAQVAGQTAANAATAREVGRDKETEVNRVQDTQRLASDVAYQNQLLQQAELDLKRRDEKRTSKNDAYKSALSSALALNMKDVKATRPAGVPNISFSGGGRPSAIGAQGTAAAAEMNRQAMDSLMNGTQFSELEAPGRVGVTAAPKATGVDTALGIGGAIGKALESFGAGQKDAQTSSLIAELLKRSQADAAGGLDVKTKAPVAPAAPVAPPPPSVVAGDPRFNPNLLDQAAWG